MLISGALILYFQIPESIRPFKNRGKTKVLLTYAARQQGQIFAIIFLQFFSERAHAFEKIEKIRTVPSSEPIPKWLFQHSKESPNFGFLNS